MAPGLLIIRLLVIVLRRVILLVIHVALAFLLSGCASSGPLMYLVIPLAFSVVLGAFLRGRNLLRSVPAAFEMSGLVICAPLVSVVVVVWQLFDDHHSGFNVLVGGFSLDLAVTILYERVVRLHALVLLRPGVPLGGSLVSAVGLKNRIVVNALVIALTLHNGHWLIPLPLNVAPVVVPL